MLYLRSWSFLLCQVYRCMATATGKTLFQASGIPHSLILLCHYFYFYGCDLEASYIGKWTWPSIFNVHTKTYFTLICQNNFRISFSSAVWHLKYSAQNFRFLVRSNYYYFYTTKEPLFFFPSPSYSFLSQEYQTCSNKCCQHCFRNVITMLSNCYEHVVNMRSTWYQNVTKMLPTLYQIWCKI